MPRLPVLIFFLAAGNAWGCGYCVEDKVAAVYDHAAVTRSIAAGRTVVFFAIDGELKHGAAASAQTRARIEKLAAAVPGIEPGSVRASSEAAALAVAFDPKRASLAQVQKALEQKLKVSLLAMKVMDRPGELAELPASARR
jgi:hypothetical protein